MPAKTSVTHPLRIDRMSCGAGVVGMTLCPGKHASSAFGGYWERDLGLDLREIVDWGATTLVSIIERSELSAFGVSNLDEAAEEVGLEWHHLPIKDVHIPDERFERRWTYSGQVLRRRLQSGERLVLTAAAAWDVRGRSPHALRSNWARHRKRRYAVSERPE